MSATGLEAQVLSSSLSALRRVSLLSAFATGDLPVLVVTPASQRGVNLQRASLVAHLDLPASSALFAQRNARAARVGHPTGHVEVLVPFLAGTWDEAWVRQATDPDSAGELDPLTVRSAPDC